ncbi:MAG: hypothetical protein WAN65_09390 [Candidatus Sulfotelmatobacter sp.]
MSLSDLASIGSLVSGVAVVGSLVFLAVQIRQSNLNQRAIVHQTRVTRSADLVLRAIEPSLLQAWMMGASGDPDIGAEQHWQYVHLMRTFLLGMEDTFFQHRLGLIEDSVFLGVSQLNYRHFAQPGMRAAWKQLRDVFDPAFAVYGDKLAEEGRRSVGLINLEEWLKLADQEKKLQERA